MNATALPRMRLLGSPVLENAELDVPFLAERSHQLLACLALRSGEWVTRDRLAALFWPEHASAEARRNLRKVIFRARSVHGAEWLTVPLAFLQAFGTVQFINATTGQPIITNFGFDHDPVATFALLVSMTAGTLLLIWIGELITQQGIGNARSPTRRRAAKSRCSCCATMRSTSRRWPSCCAPNASSASACRRSAPTRATPHAWPRSWVSNPRAHCANC